MTEFIIKKFIKNPDNTEDNNVRESYGIVISVIGILCNALLFIIKLIIGIVVSSVSVMADSFNNLLDAGSSLVSLIGFKMANKPADKEHPFGHGRIEYISAFIISIIILLLGFEFLKTSIDKILNPEVLNFNILSIVFLFITILIKLWLAVINKSIGKKINSEAMFATAQDSINDVFITSATIISILVAHFTKYTIDGYVGVLVACILLYSGYSVAKEVLSRLLGEPTDKDLAEKIIKKIESYEGIIGAHDLVVHNYGPNKSMATIHAEVPADVSIIKSHKIIDTIEKEIEEEFNIIIVIHMDPVDIYNEKLKSISRTVLKYIEENELPLDAHEFIIVKEEEELLHLSFELGCPYEYTKDEIEKVKNDIVNEIIKVNGKYRCTINDENGFIKD